jgi:hypothetical protein
MWGLATGSGIECDPTAFDNRKGMRKQTKEVSGAYLQELDRLTIEWASL